MLANHGTTGWRQIAKITRQHGTPIPVTITFPWGEQQFWGDWPGYNWQLGQLGAQPLECAFLAISYWAFRQIESGRPVDEVIQLVLQGNEAIAAPGLALRLALELFHISIVRRCLHHTRAILDVTFNDRNANGFHRHGDHFRQIIKAQVERSVLHRFFQSE